MVTPADGDRASSPRRLAYHHAPRSTPFGESHPGRHLSPIPDSRTDGTFVFFFFFFLRTFASFIHDPPLRSNLYFRSSLRHSNLRVHSVKQKRETYTILRSMPYTVDFFDVLYTIVDFFEKRSARSKPNLSFLFCLTSPLV